MMSHLQTITLLEKICVQSRRPLKWSKYDPDRFAVIVQNGVYIVKLTPVPINTLLSLNTRPKLIYNEFNEEVNELEWLPNHLIMYLTRSKDLYIKNSENDKTLMKIDQSDIYSFAVFDKFLITTSTNQHISVFAFELDDILSCNILCSKKSEELICDVLTASIGSTLIMFASLKNGLVVAYKMVENSQLDSVPESIWGDDDYLEAKNMLIVRDDFIESRTLTLLFCKGTYVVISELDLSNPTLQTIMVKRQQCIQISNHSIISVLESIPGEEYVVGVEHGPLNLLRIPADLGQASDFIPMDSTDFDKMMYKIRDFQNSRNGGIWTILQTTLISKEHTKLIFLTNQNINDLLEKFVLDANIKNLTIIPDYLEVMRLLLLQCQTISQELYSKLNHLSRVSPIHYWISNFFATLNSPPGSWSNLRNYFSLKLLQSHASEVLNVNFDPNSGKNLIDYWTCHTCQAKPADIQPYTDIAICENEHKWPRCSKTLQICQSAVLAQCTWCGALANPQFHESNCILCSGILIAE